MSKITRKVTIPIKEWRFGQSALGTNSVRTEDGRRCVLHFVQEQLLGINETTVRYSEIMRYGDNPAGVFDPLLLSEIYRCNDQTELTLDERMAKLGNVALKAGIKLEFKA